MLLGCIADDFTGGSDLANTLAKGGMSTVQFMGIPKGNMPKGCEAGVVSLKTRSLPVKDAVAQSLEALKWLKSQGCRQFLFKYCSTFDSTVLGNIGPVAEALMDALDAPVAVVCPVFPATGRTLYMGHLFVKDRLLSESGMQNHPLTPMTDPDIARWLQLQIKGEVGRITYPTVHQGAAAITAAFDVNAKAGQRLVIVDALFDDDLRQIGRAVAGHKLVTGGSGIAIGLPENFRVQGLLEGSGAKFVGHSGPAIVLSGSCSTASMAQVAAFAAKHPSMPVDPDALMAGEMTPAKAMDFIHANKGRVPILYSTSESAKVAMTQERYGREAIAHKIEQFFGDVAIKAVAAGITRVLVGGGETSGAVVSALGIDHVLIGPEIDPGVPALASDVGAPLRLALKSGNFGGMDFYEKALGVLEGA
jgi:3-dehydrotetronate 4-kinase